MNRLRACLLSSALLSASSAQALGLLDAYQLAVRHDPTFQAALHERRAGSENRAIGRAGLLPSLRYDYNKARNDSTVSQGDARVERDYRSYASTLSLEQPLFDYEAYARYRQGEAQALFADEQFRGRSQELAVRLFAAYSETLFAREQVVLAEAQRRALETQLAFNQRAFEEGEGTRTDLLETRARLSLTRAEEIAASDRAAAARRTLEAMLGQALEDRELAAPIERFPALRLQPATFEGWRQVALQRSAELGAQRHALEAAAYEVERNRAGHLPRLSLYASSSKTHSASESTYEQKYDTDSVGLRLSLPLFEGGRVSAATRQAGDKYAQAQAELDAQVASVINDLHSQFDLTASSLAKVRAYEMAVAAAREQVTATRRSVAGGERVNRDVLDAEQQFYGARRDLAEARYAYLKAWLRLRQLAGCWKTATWRCWLPISAPAKDARRSPLPSDSYRPACLALGHRLQQLRRAGAVFDGDAEADALDHPLQLFQVMQLRRSDQALGGDPAFVGEGEDDAAVRPLQAEVDPVLGLEGLGEELERAAVGHGGPPECCRAGWDWVPPGKFFVTAGLYPAPTCGRLSAHVPWPGPCTLRARWPSSLSGEAMKQNWAERLRASMHHQAESLGNLLVEAFHYLALFAIGATVFWAAGAAFLGMVNKGHASIDDILLLFIYLELGAMVGIYFKTNHMPVRFLIYVAMTALTRLMIADIQHNHTPDDGIILVSVALLLLALAILVVRFASARFPSAKSDGAAARRVASEDAEGEA